MNNIYQVLTVAKKEYRDALKSILFLSLLSFLLLLTGISLLVAGFHFQAEVSAYTTALAQLKQMGQTGAILTKPQYYPLQMLRGTIEYLEIIGALIAIVLGYTSIAKEKESNTLQLVLSRPVTSLRFIGGKILGNSLIILSLLTVLFIFIIFSFTVVGHVTLSQIELLKLFLSFIFSYLYLMFFYAISVVITFLMKHNPHALVLGLVLWLTIVLIIPQIGDTMDPDNAVPGGLFASMHMTKPQQTAVMSHFTTYETLRNAVEESSVEKHYERLTFATLGIKNIYNGKTLSQIFKDQWYNFYWVAGFFLSGLLVTSLTVSKKRILRS